MSPLTWEFTYNGLTIGGSNPIGITSVIGLDPPGARLDEVDRANDHGSYAFGQFLNSREVVIEGDVADDPSTFEAKITQLRKAFGVPQALPLPLSYLVAGDVAKRVYCIPIDTDFPIADNYDIGGATWAVRLKAEDPRLYSDSQSAMDISPLLTNGIGFNLGFNVNFGGGSGGTAGIVNNGIFETRPVIVVSGPITAPILLTNITQNKSLVLNLGLSPTDSLTIDFAAKTIRLNGTASRYGALDLSSSAWWTLQPGSNTIQFVNSSGTGRVSIFWRDAWL